MLAFHGNGVSETIIGKAIKKYNIPGHKVVILTNSSASATLETN